MWINDLALASIDDGGGGRGVLDNGVEAGVRDDEAA